MDSELHLASGMLLTELREGKSRAGTEGTEMSERLDHLPELDSTKPIIDDINCEECREGVVFSCLREEPDLPSSLPTSYIIGHYRTKELQKTTKYGA